MVFLSSILSIKYIHLIRSLTFYLGVTLLRSSVLLLLFFIFNIFLLLLLLLLLSYFSFFCVLFFDVVFVSCVVVCTGRG